MLSKDDMTFLASYEKQMRTAVQARWISHLPDVALQRMLEIWENLTGERRSYRKGCDNCALGLVSDLGRLYFRQKEAEAQKLEKAQAQGSEESSTEKETKPSAGAKKAVRTKNNK